MYIFFTLFFAFFYNFSSDLKKVCVSEGTRLDFSSKIFELKKDGRLIVYEEKTGEEIAEAKNVSDIQLQGVFLAVLFQNKALEVKDIQNLRSTLLSWEKVKNISFLSCSNIKELQELKGQALLESRGNIVGLKIKSSS